MGYHVPEAFDAAGQTETRSFPKDAIFTGWFDTGSQDQTVWPGKFKVVEHPPTVDGWDHVRSVPHDTTGIAYISVGMRGTMQLRNAHKLMFRYHSTASKADVVLKNSDSGEEYRIKVEDLKASAKIEDTVPVLKWDQYELDFSSPSTVSSTGMPLKFSTIITDIEFHPIGDNAELRVDDIWLLEHESESTPVPTPVVTGTPNANVQDLCPEDDEKVAPGTCGCGVAEVNSDSDSLPDCADLCPYNGSLFNPDIKPERIKEATAKLKIIKRKLKAARNSAQNPLKVNRLIRQLQKTRAERSKAKLPSCL